MKAIFILTFLVSSVKSYSVGHDKGNGGDGVFLTIDGVERPYLLDFVEKNVHLNPYFEDKTVFAPNVRDKIKEHLNSEIKGLAELVAAKILEFDNKAPTLGFMTKMILFALDWTFTDLPITDVRDHGDTVYDFKGKKMVQFAVRRGSNVTVSRKACKQATLENCAGVIAHEIQYAYAPVKEKKITVFNFLGQAQKLVIKAQDGNAARMVNGSLFTAKTIKNLKHLKVRNLFNSNGYTFYIPFNNFSDQMVRVGATQFADGYAQVLHLKKNWGGVRYFLYLDKVDADYLVPIQNGFSIETSPVFKFSNTQHTKVWNSWPSKYEVYNEQWLPDFI